MKILREFLNKWNNTAYLFIKPVSIRYSVPILTFCTKMTRVADLHYHKDKILTKYFRRYFRNAQ